MMNNHYMFHYTGTYYANRSEKIHFKENFVLKMISWLGTEQKKKYTEVVNTSVTYRKEN